MANEIFKLRSSNPPPRETEFIPHSHPEFEIGYFKSGSGIYTVKNKKYDIRPGDIFLFGSDELHKITTIRADSPMQTLAVLFQPRLVWDAMTDDFSSDLLNAFRALGAKNEHRIDKTHAVYDKLVSCIFNIEAEWNGQKPFYRKAIKNSILDFLITLSRTSEELPDTDEADEAFRDVLPLINASVDAIEEHFCEELRIHDLASDCGMSQNFFTSCFKKINGIIFRVLFRHRDYSSSRSKSSAPMLRESFLIAADFVPESSEAVSSALLAALSFVLASES